jgi:hypothetical protein
LCFTFLSFGKKCAISGKRVKILGYDIPKSLPFLFLPLPSKGRKRFWDKATLVRGNGWEKNGKLIIRVFIFNFITINETLRM